mmetsp:Transcript_23347/g.51083  ORF Transcript_23347/g.51083 Transcript_23347/m.51083 type:complete len:654 (-) Transcript_23347:2877-4838(-)
MGEYNNAIIIGGGNNNYPSLQESKSDETSEDTVMSTRSSDTENEHTLLLPSGGEDNTTIEYNCVDGYSISSTPYHQQQQTQTQKLLEYRHQNRFVILALVAITPTGVKFFKAAQSSFEEYLMHDPRLLMNATTYSFILSLMSLPVATLVGGAMLDYKSDNKDKHKRKQTKQNIREERNNKNQRKNHATNFNCPSISSLLSSCRHSCLETSRVPSYSAVFFLVISLLGIAIYGYALEVQKSIPMGLVGATVFGLGEGCVVVASRTFVAHAFYGSDGAFAQGVLVAMNNVAMMASKISLPWLIENDHENKLHSIIRTRSYSDCIHDVMNNPECFDDDAFAFEHGNDYAAAAAANSKAANENNIWIGILACCAVQLVSLIAGILYAWWFGLAPPPQNLRIKTTQPNSNSNSNLNKYSREQQEPGQPSRENEKRPLSNSSGSGGGSIYSRATACFENLPPTFWIVAIGRAIFVVVFKVFTRNSNSFLMEKFGVSAVAAGRKSSLHELFALGSPLVGFLAYRSPGGIVPVLLFAAALAFVSIATLACIPAGAIVHYLPGGAMAPMIGISVSHGIFIPICMAIIPQTCSPEHLGMAFAVVEVLGSIFNLTNILFGWLRDATGNYKVPMELLLLYTLVGMSLLWTSRNHIKLKQHNNGEE